MATIATGPAGFRLRLARAVIHLLWSLVALSGVSLLAAGHGPVFGLATPTNPRGGFSFDFSTMGRTGEARNASMMRLGLGYGVTEDLKLTVSVPTMFTTTPLVPAVVSPLLPMSGDVEILGTWRFSRRDTGVGSRLETALIGGVALPTVRDTSGFLQNVRSGVGQVFGGVSGLASRSDYFWAGALYHRYNHREGDHRPDVLTYSLAYAHRPSAWRTDKGWDWRIFGEMTGERASVAQQSSQTAAGSDGHQIFLGPTTLGVFRNYAVSGGVQFPIYRAVSSVYATERFRWSVNFAYFF